MPLQLSNHRILFGNECFSLQLKATKKQGCCYVEEEEKKRGVTVVLTLHASVTETRDRMR